MISQKTDAESILDLGCGSGFISNVAKNYFKQRYALDIGKITGETSWYPKTHLREGLEKTVDWYLDNQDWLDAVEKYINSRDWKHWEDFKKFDE